MKKSDKEFILLFLIAIMIALGLAIIDEFIMTTISWVMIKLIMVEAAFIFGWLWLSKQEQK